MRIIIELKYKGKQLGAYNLADMERSNTAALYTITIDKIVDEQVRDALRRTIKKLTTAAALAKTRGDE